MFIGTDNFKAGQIGGDVLAKQLKGKGNVVVFSMPQQANLKERLRGYQDVLANHPQIKITEVVDIKGDPRIAFDKTMEILKKDAAKVDAFVCLEAVACPEVADVLERNKIDKIVSPWTPTRGRWKGSRKAGSRPPSAKSHTPWPTSGCKW